MPNPSQIKKDQIIFFIWPMIAVVISFLIQANFFASMLLFFGIPSLYLSLRNSGMVKKIALFCLPGFIIAIIIDYICVFTGTWFIPVSVFEYRILGLVTIDGLIWCFLQAFLIVAYYEYFLENKTKDVLYRPRFKCIYLYFLSIMAIFFAVLIIDKNWLYIRYFYLIFGMILCAIPLAAFLVKFPNLISKFAKTGIYFFYVSIVYELTALSLNQWSFPGTDYIGMVTLFNLSFPFEEFVFWMVIGAMSLLSYYEFFDDDQK